MFLPGSFGVALAMMIGGMIGWGSWPNTFKITRQWPFELYYFDFAAGIVLTALAAWGTLGMFFGKPTAWDNLTSAPASAWIWCLVAGALWNFANVLLVNGIAVVGMAVAFPVAIGLALVLSTITSYLVMPQGSVLLLSLGVGAVLAAVLLNSFAYRTAVKERGSVSSTGLWACAIAGVLISFAGPAVGKALTSKPALSPYSIALLFTLAASVTTFPIIGYFARRPLQGPGVELRAYWQGSWRSHALGIAGGAIWSSATVLTWTAASLVGIALAGAIGQANPLVAALWGLLVWKEFSGSNVKSKILLVLMFAFYGAGLGLLALSYGQEAPPPVQKTEGAGMWTR